METFLTILIAIGFLVTSYYIGRKLIEPEDWLDNIMSIFFGMLIIIVFVMVLCFVYVTASEIAKYVLY